MKISRVWLVAIFIFFASSSLFAGEVILYGGTQSAGKLTWSEATDTPSNLFDGDVGVTMGIRVSANRAVGLEQNMSFTPQFGKPGVRAIQTDSNLLIQAPGKVVPYVTAGIGLIRTWGQERPSNPDPEKTAAFGFNLGTKFSVNYGGGLKVRRLLGPLGLNVDVRGYTIFNARDSLLHLIQASAGLAFTW